MKRKLTQPNSNASGMVSMTEPWKLEAEQI
jgi:hypothetical protein